MGRQVWGTFSVMDHCRPAAFVADVLLYDRRVIPRPPVASERERWEAEGWDPEKQELLLRILGERAWPVDWNEQRRAAWENRYLAGRETARQTAGWALAATRTELTQGLPRNITGIQAVTHYS